MTSVLSQHTQLSYSPRATAGILLKPTMRHQPFSLPASSYPSRNHHPSTQSLASSTSSSEDVNTPSSSDNATPPLSLSNSLSLPYISDDDHLPRSRTGSAISRRSIRFAPLPDPRRAVLVTEHGEELPLPCVFDDDDSSTISRPALRNFPAQPSPSLLLEGAVIAPRQFSATITSNLASPRPQNLRSSSVKNRPSSSPTPSNATVTPVTSSSNSLSKRFLPSFWHKTDDSLPSGSRDSSSSRDGSPPSFGIPLAHWATADAASRRGSTSSTNGAPLARAQSASFTCPKPKRLLNGRVYGARKHPHYLPANVFDNVPDKEPEFVEWGHGGMGSVRAGGIWSKVQSDQKLLIGHTEERGRRGTPATSPVDQDDGSGMGWVKKRREERERKKREEQAERETVGKTNVVPTLVSDATPSPESTQVSVDHNVATVTLSQPTPEDDDEDDEDEEETKYDSEQEDDDAAEEHFFKQVVGAGVERVSRHRD